MTYRILGVDPGLTRCGIGVISVGPGRSVQLVEVEVLRTDAADPLAHRLTALDRALTQWLTRLRPDAVAVEQVFAQHNVRTVTGTAQVAGLAMVAATRADIPVATHTPSEIKAAVTGSGRAGKDQVQEMVRRILRLADKPRPADAADALALAITHAWRAGAAGPRPAVTMTPAQRSWTEAAARSRRTPAAPRTGAGAAGRLRAGGAIG
ncbi:crossover junction endodeoxyribonuclease RuvC [Pseudactinotalea sp. Z1739]|uniref:crossover junction endodeoxyribonuclease RuvC n=1 Tax=Pseudactinotalea sp. Z1739 TaxID=3413028 RepID=UPI003C7B67DC